MTTWLLPLAGGILIGLSSVALMATLGRIAGISGIAGGLLPPKPAADWPWRLAFILGLIGGGILVAPWLPQNLPGVPAVPTLALPLAGFLVGFGTILGAGCTSGHGICGMARLSKRSFAATALFMATAMLTVFITRHIL